MLSQEGLVVLQEDCVWPWTSKLTRLHAACSGILMPMQLDRDFTLLCATGKVTLPAMKGILELHDTSCNLLLQGKSARNWNQTGKADEDLKELDFSSNKDAANGTVKMEKAVVGPSMMDEEEVYDSDDEEELGPQANGKVRRQCRRAVNSLKQQERDPWIESGVAEV